MWALKNCWEVSDLDRAKACGGALLICRKQFQFACKAHYTSRLQLETRIHQLFVVMCLLRVDGGQLN